MKSATAFAPATIANLGSGFDILGLALNTIGDTVTATKISDKKINYIPDPNYPELPTDNSNICVHVAEKILSSVNPTHGIEIRLQKKIPIGSGMGGSAASATATAVAVNAIFGKPYTKNSLLQFALSGEQMATDSFHADNVAPALFGGLCLISNSDPIKITQLPINKSFYWIIAHPNIRLDTKTMRACLPDTIKFTKHNQQNNNLAALIVGLLQNNNELIKQGIHDSIVTPIRKKLIPGFDDVFAAAMQYNAIGCGISGSGPALFALANDKNAAEQVAQVMQKTFKQAAQLDSKTYISTINLAGTILLGENKNG